MDNSSDIESLLSADSLEDGAFVNCNKIKSKEKPHKIDINLRKYNYNSLIPYYRGQAPIEEIKYKQIKKEPGKPPNFNNIYIDLSIENNDNASFTSNSTPEAEKSQSAGREIRRRVSRRIETFTDISDSVRCRNKSVSYLEEFKKRSYGYNRVGKSVCSIIGSEQSDINKSMSYLSCISCENTTSTSEFEFYKELIKNKMDKQSVLNSTVNLQLDGVKLANSTSVPKSNKVKIVALPKIIQLKHPHQVKEFEMRNFLQKREVYSSKVKVRNQINIRLQREKDKLKRSKVTYPEMWVKEGNLNHNIDDKPTNSTTPSVPFSNLEHSASEQKKTARPKRKVSKLHKNGENQTKSHKTEVISRLTTLQQRHEGEKHIVESIRNLVLKT